jgi:hypothetical protein
LGSFEPVSLAPNYVRVVYIRESSRITRPFRARGHLSD